MTPLHEIGALARDAILRLLAEHDAESDEARYPQATTDPRPSGETPDPTWRTAQQPDPVNQRRADAIAQCIRHVYGILQDLENDQRHKADNTRRRAAVRDGLCCVCMQQPTYANQRCRACEQYLRRNGEERPEHLWNRRRAG